MQNTHPPTAQNEQLSAKRADAEQLRREVLVPERWKILNPGERVMGGQGQKIVYAVLNGAFILTIGEGKTARMPSLPGTRCKKHTKAFIIAAAWCVLDPAQGNEYWYRCCQTKTEAKERQDELHRVFGSIYFPNGDGIPTKDVELVTASNWLWNRLKKVTSHLSPELNAQIELALRDGDVLSTLLKHSRWKNEAKAMLNGYYA